jgi:acyl-CoA reductase-like NAD-dependent aldehyde dehydrogenase
LHENLREAGLAPQFVDTVNGAGHVGQRLIDGPIDHCVFTGGVGVGRQVLQRLGSRGVPAVAELSGFDPAIVLPDADLESTVRNLCWSAFVSAGQTCVAVKRVYVLEKLDEWSERFERAATSLRVGDPASGDIDMGPLISDAARQRFLQFVANAVQAGAKLLTGGTAIDGPGYFVRPTVLVAEDGAAEQALAGVFGPLLILRRVPTVDDALAAANASPYGLAASVWGRDRRLLRATAQRLNAGVVSINDAVSPAGHAAAPFGGVKASGYGRTHGPYGLLEFTQPVALHERNHGSWRPQLYPYSQRLWKLLSLYKKFVHRA